MMTESQKMHVCHAALFLMIAVIFPVLVIIGDQARPNDIVLIIGWDPVSIAASLDLVIMSPEDAPFAVLAMAGDRASLEQLHQSSAWLVVDGNRMAALCGL
ncbi:MAG: hypothetical protein AAGM38_14870 [Pseudomonadota bacterium]